MISSEETKIVELIDRNLEELDPLDAPDFSSLLKRIGDAEVVLLGESTHGTCEFYDLRAQITMELIRRKGFTIVLLESDWPDTEDVNKYIHGRKRSWNYFRRFPEWMWRNVSFGAFVEKLREYNLSSEARPRVSIFGMDLYSLTESLAAVGRFIHQHLPDYLPVFEAAEGCLKPWHFDHAHYGLAVLRGVAKSCEPATTNLLKLLYEKEVDLPASKPELLSALQNARIVKNAEQYYRTIYEGSIRSWNLRDEHMFETLSILKQYFGAHNGHDSGAKVVVWAHNSHIGNAAATEMGALGEINIGQLCKSKFGSKAYNIGFMTNHGTVRAADYWGGEAKVKALLRARPDSYEALLHRTRAPNYLLPLKKDPELQDALLKPRLERAVGVIYRPDNERASHYFEAVLANQFDEICWVDETSAVTPFEHVKEVAETDTYPFGL